MMSLPSSLPSISRPCSATGARRLTSSPPPGRPLRLRWAMNSRGLGNCSQTWGRKGGPVPAVFPGSRRPTPGRNWARASTSSVKCMRFQAWRGWRLPRGVQSSSAVRWPGSGVVRKRRAQALCSRSSTRGRWASRCRCSPKRTVAWVKGDEGGSRLVASHSGKGGRWKVWPNGLGDGPTGQRVVSRRPLSVEVFIASP